MERVLCDFLPPPNPHSLLRAGAFDIGWPEGHCGAEELAKLTSLAAVPCALMGGQALRLAVIGRLGASGPYWPDEIRMPLEEFGRNDSDLKNEAIVLRKKEGLTYALAYRGRAGQEETITNESLTRVCRDSWQAGWLLFTITYGTCFLRPGPLSETPAAPPPSDLAMCNPFCLDPNTVAGHHLQLAVSEFMSQLGELKVKEMQNDWLFVHLSRGEDYYAQQGQHEVSEEVRAATVASRELTQLVRNQLARLLASLGCNHVSCGAGISNITDGMQRRGWIANALSLKEELSLLASELAHGTAPDLGDDRPPQLHVLRRISLCVYLHSILNAIPRGISLVRAFPPVRHPQAAPLAAVPHVQAQPLAPQQHVPTPAPPPNGPPSRPVEERRGGWHGEPPPFDYWQHRPPPTQRRLRRYENRFF